jgi:predicted 3-demethylubiquinone-9 3-methyltransferase (glyoxalase superfamily)
MERTKAPAGRRSMQKIIPHLWFDTQAREAAEFYTSLFRDSGIVSAVTHRDTPSGDTQSIRFMLAGQLFHAISAGPIFKLNPSVSLMVYCATVEEVDALWSKLFDGGSALMPLDEYPFSRRYGWLQDRFGLSWQLMLVDEEPTQKIVPCMLFSGAANGLAEDATRYYAEVIPNSKVDFISRYEKGEAESPNAKVNYIAFELAGQKFSAMDNAYDVPFTFSEAFSLMVVCQDKHEIDAYWERLSHVPEAEACGWLKDRFGVSWQIVPQALDEMMEKGSEEQVRRVTKAFLKMKKLEIEPLKTAYNDLSDDLPE